MVILVCDDPEQYSESECRKPEDEVVDIEDKILECC